MLTAKQRGQIKSDMARRVMGASDTLASELVSRGILPKRELKALANVPKWDRMSRAPRICNGPFSAELANADRQLAARAVVRGLLSCAELHRLETMLRFQPRGKRVAKLDDLLRTVERAIEKCEGGMNGNGC